MHDLLLSYTSEKGAGSWQQLRDTWDWLGPDRDPADKAWIASQDLSALGHIEIQWEENGGSWCATPPVVTMIPRSGGRALVTGARTRALFEPHRDAAGSRPETAARGRLLEIAEELGLYVDQIPRVNAPTTAYVACATPDDAEQLAAQLGASYTFSVAAQLAEMLPPMADYERLWPPGQLCAGFDAEVLNVDELKWMPATSVEAPGLYRAQIWDGSMHALNGPVADSWRRVNLQHGTYEVLRWHDRQVLRYRPSSYELAVPWNAPLPELQSRAAVLSSGLLPRGRNWEVEGRGHLYFRVYCNVEEHLAQQIASSLSQELIYTK